MTRDRYAIWSQRFGAWLIDVVVFAALLGYSRAFARAYLTLVLWARCAVPGILDGLWPLWDSRRQALHDKVVRTIVVRVTT